MWTAMATLCLSLTVFVAAGMAVCLAAPEKLQHNGVIPSRAGIGATFSTFLVILLSGAVVSAIQSSRTKMHNHPASGFSLRNRAADDAAYAASRVAMDQAAQSCTQAVALVGLAVYQNDMVDISGAGSDAQHDCALAQQKTLSVQLLKDEKSYAVCLDMAKQGQIAGAQVAALSNGLSAVNEALLRQSMNHFTWLSLGCVASAYRAPPLPGSR